MNHDSRNNNSNEWKLVSANKDRVNRKTPLHQSQPILTIINQYIILDDLQNKFQSPQRHEHVNKMTLKSKNIKYTLKPRKKKIIVIGDSHARGCAREISDYLGNEFEVGGTVMPESGLANITALALEEILALTKDEPCLWVPVTTAWRVLRLRMNGLRYRG